MPKFEDTRKFKISTIFKGQDIVKDLLGQVRARAVRSTAGCGAVRGCCRSARRLAAAACARRAARRRARAHLTPRPVCAPAPRRAPRPRR